MERLVQIQFKVNYNPDEVEELKTWNGDEKEYVAEMLNRYTLEEMASDIEVLRVNRV